MKIYTRIVFDGSGTVLESDSHDYNGPLALCKGGDGGNEVPETAEEKALATVARQEYDRHQKEFVELENKFINDSKATEDKYQRTAGQSTTAIKQDLANGMAGLDRAPGSPTSGPNAARGLDLEIKGAEAAASAETKSALNVQDAEATNLQAAINLGRGQAGGVVQGMGGIAANAASDAIRKTQDDWTASNDMGAAVMTGAGMAARGLQKKTP